MGKMSEKEYEWQQNELGEYSYQPIKRKFKLPAWLTALVVSVGASAVCLTIYSAAVLPHMRPTTVISYSAASDETAEDGAISAAGFVGMAERLGDSIVSVNVKGQSSGFFSQMVSYGGGTGIVVSSDGYILTSNSALGRQTTGITVTLSTGEQLDAEVVGSDSKIDCAVLKIEKSGLTAVELADSDSALSGMKVAALGRVLSSQLGTTLTQGTICGVNKGVALQGGQTINLLQTDATAPDNTGSALLDSDGKLLGMVTSMISSGSDSIALAIPSNDIMQVVESVTNTAVSPSGLTIGIRGQDAEYGVAIEAVSENSPAAKAGLAEGDLIMKVDGTTVKTVSEINKLRDTHSHGDTMVFTVYRDGETMDISVKLD
jgi:serine protease Do